MGMKKGVKKRTGEEGWVLLDTVTALLLIAVVLGAMGPLLGRTAKAALRLRQGTGRLIEIRNGIAAPPGGADEPH
jgi:hypothetical protein